MTRPTASSASASVADGDSAHTDRYAREHLPPPEQWPELRFDLPELQYPPRLNCVAELFDGALAGGAAERVAIRGEQLSWTYAQLLEQIDRIAHVLRGPLGLEAGNRVLLRGANNPMMAACVLAVLKAGCIAVPTMPLLRARELETIMDKAQVNAVLCANGLRAEIDALELAPSVRARLLWFGSGAGCTGTVADPSLGTVAPQAGAGRVLEDLM